MPALFLYLLQVNLGLVLFYGAYQLVLRQTTFHAWNRFFFLAGILLSAALPLVDVNLLLAQNVKVYQTISAMSFDWAAPPIADAATSSFDYWLIPLALFWLGVGVMAVRLIVQVASLYSIHRRSRPANYQGIAYREMEADLPPFSFWNTIYFNSSNHPEQTWRGILQHELTHVQQAHTLDILLAELTTVFLWFNPVAWRLRTALKQNLEFLTDCLTLQAGIDRKQYQFSLLQTTSALPLSLASSFSFHSLKHRIMMMNQQPTAKVQRVRFLATLPLLVFFLLGFQGLAKSGAEWKGLLRQTSPAGKTQGGQSDYQAFLRRNPTVKGLGWSNGKVSVQLKSGETETYPNTPAGLARAAQKYGRLPSPPPPPPVPAAPPAAPAAPLAPPPPAPLMNVPLTKEFKQRNPTVKGISSVEDGIHVILNSGEVESFDNTAAGAAAFEKKYGILPPPPPPVRIKKFPPPVKNN